MPSSHRSEQKGILFFNSLEKKGATEREAKERLRDRYCFVLVKRMSVIEKEKRIKDKAFGRGYGL